MRKDEYRQGALGDVEQRDGDRVFPAEDAVDVRRAEIVRSVLAQVDSAPQLAGDVTGRRRPEQIRRENREYDVQRRPRLRRNWIVSGAPRKSHASRKRLCR